MEFFIAKEVDGLKGWVKGEVSSKKVKASSDNLHDHKPTVKDIVSQHAS